MKKLSAYFIRKHEFGLASRIFQSINDMKSIVDMHVNAGHWTDVSNNYFQNRLLILTAPGICNS